MSRIRLNCHCQRNPRAQEDYPTELVNALCRRGTAY